MLAGRRLGLCGMAETGWGIASLRTLAQSLEQRSGAFLGGRVGEWLLQQVLRGYLNSLRVAAGHAAPAEKQVLPGALAHRRCKLPEHSQSLGSLGVSPETGAIVRALGSCLEEKIGIRLTADRKGQGVDGYGSRLFCLTNY